MSPPDLHAGSKPARRGCAHVDAVRLLFTTCPAHGHLLPMLPLAAAAQRAGHEVVVATGAEGVVEAAQRGFATWDVGPSRAEADAAFRAAVPDLGVIAPEQRIPTVVAGVFGAAAFRRAEALVPLATNWRPDVVVHSVTETAGAIAAARTGALHVVHGLGPLPAEAWSWFGARFGELCATWGVPDLAHSILDAPFIDLCPPSLQGDAVAAFGNRVLLQPSHGDVAGVLPWDGATLRALPHERTVHLTLGTIFHGATGVFETVLDGLRQLPVNVLVAVGPGTDPARLGPQPRNVLVTDYAPHASVLPLCDGLITQGGAGTILAALCHGLPHLILPQGADQFANAATAERAGVALQIPPQKLTPAIVAAGVDYLLTEDTIGANARRIAAEIRTMPSAADIVATLCRRASMRAGATTSV